MYDKPEEKLRQLMAWYPNKKLYRRPSGKSNKSIVSVYPPESQCPVYSHEEWYADDWDPPYLNFNPSIPFFAQWKELQNIAPVVSLLSHRQENAEYCHDVEGLKNCYLVFDSLNTQDSYYSVRLYNCKSCIDVYWVMDSELLYECVYMFSCYNCRYCFNCEQSYDSAFLFNCHNVNNSFMCSNLRNKKYCAYNKQLTKEEYEKLITKIDFKNHDQIETLKKDFQQMTKNTPIPPAFLRNCEDSTGNYLKNCQNVKHGFECFDLKDCFNVFQCAKGKDITNAFMCNDRIEHCFNCVATGIGSFQVKNCAFTWKSANMEYCYLCISCQDCFGCIGLRNKQYHIFNKPYTRESYSENVKKIIESMKKNGGYGNFFPIELSPFPYEDTIAFDFFENEVAHPIDQTIRPIPQELKFYEKYGIPTPKISFPARYHQRIKLMDTSFTEKNGTFYQHPEQRNIVSQDEYEKSL
ncbi:MAG: hypothetical protein V1880_02205 [Patescibacteria group bacterium]